MKSVLKKILPRVLFLTVYFAATFVAYEFLSLFFTTMSGPLVFGITALAELILMFAFFGVIMMVTRRTRKREIRDMHEKLTNALSEISSGNFDIALDYDKNAPHNELAEAINELARNLGALEAMRQDFISNVSHEIQSPLTSIGGFAKLLRDDALSPEQREHYVDIIVTESDRLSNLSENLLKLSTLDDNKIPLNKTEFRLDKQLESVVLSLEPQWAGKNISLKADLRKHTVNADADLLSQVWTNLLGNAVKFTPDGGRISISLAEENGNAVVRISDTGVGIASEDRIHIFERFYKVDKARDRALGGNGLGLSIVKKIAELHNGRVSVESELGKGATFTVRLPL
jgi:signal transduction histidine kinase